MTKKKIVSTQGNTKKRLGISSESYGAFNKSKKHTPVIIKKSEEQVHRIKEKIKQSILFRELNGENLAIVINAMKEEVFQPESVVIKAGEEGNSMYFVETGNLTCVKNRKNEKGEEETVLLRAYVEGDSFGELALLYNTKRMATIRAETKSILWALDRETFHFIFKKLNIDKENKYVGFLKDISLFQNLNLTQLKQISDTLKDERVPAESIIIKIGETGDDFYILESGQANATIFDKETNSYKILKTYEPGDYFGELALIRSKPRAANIVAITDCVLLKLDRASFKRLLGPLEHLLEKNSDFYYKYYDDRKA
eukprot:CAMPEP_0170525794 /NCGR_PEP_ID=MMETSP0209-20121228/11240_1 /TAXON_ID=665100 ORGANISM="Litonotus pictus, Strain P1" /NCGR_SAMPLE_ID=MMETSP0209 /ASSEMBLY_ACC=CAM_ASM_000301 /LENGTH=311 /DNA_ID=CAMNT_0010815243 /DNA_START=144 /DNA_END=1075 /DNA_ORIENTATION=+